MKTVNNLIIERLIDQRPDELTKILVYIVLRFFSFSQLADIGV